MNPDNSAIKKLIEHRVLKNPTVLSELMEIEFSDLLQVFDELMSRKYSSIEQAYLTLLQIVEDDGAKSIKELAELSKEYAKIREQDLAEDDELVKWVKEGYERTPLADSKMREFFHSSTQKSKDEL